MNGNDIEAELFDVFLCHNGEDKPAVREIAQKLKKEGIKPWLDEEQIRPGASWQTTLGEQIESINSAAVFVGDAGPGPWQNQESQALFNQFVKRGCPVIPVVLASATTAPDMPWMFANLHCVDFRTDAQPLQRLIWGITGKKPAGLANVSFPSKPPTMQETAPRLIAGGDEEARSDNVISGARLYPALAERPDPEDTTQLNILRKRVGEYWVDGLLKHSLYNEVLISLGKREMGQAVDAPWKYTVELSAAANPAPLDHRDVSSIYDVTGLLLILGEPGAGKTTTLLNLARTLLNRAEDNINERVPVIVNLSSWKKKQPLAEWISNELSEKYRVPRKIGRLWLQRGYLLPLLDGLDEVETVMQPDCVAATNAFIEEFQPPGLVVCCRLNEYRWLPKRLKLNGAICIEPLSSEEVNKYLAAGGPKLAMLREAIDADPVLHELAQTPLMLSIMCLALQGSGSAELAARKGDSLGQCRNQIFGLYVEQVFQRRGNTSLVFPKEKVIGWLSWLAWKMREHSQSVFLVEGLQPNWLGTRMQRLSYGTVAASGPGLLFGLIIGSISTLSGLLSQGLLFGLTFGLVCFVAVSVGCWSKSRLKNGIMSGLIVGLIVGLMSPPTYKLIERLTFGASLAVIIGLMSGIGTGSMNRITLVETLSWKWNQFLKRSISGLILGLSIGLIYGLLLGMIIGRDELQMIKQIEREYRIHKPYPALIYWLTNEALTGLVTGLMFAPGFALISGIAGGFTDRVKMGKECPNQGIKLSRRNSFTSFLITFLVVGLSCGLIWLRFGRGPHALNDGLIFALGFGGVVGLIVALNRGGSAVIKHYALRLILLLSGKTPFKFIKFLDQCAKLIFLKKVGGGYIFIHRMLLDYFADLPKSTKDRDGKTDSVSS